MSHFAPAFLCLALFISKTAPAQEAPRWHEPRSTYRFVTQIDPASKPEGPLQKDAKAPSVSTLTVCPTGTDPRRLQPLVFTAEGTKVGSRVLWANQGEPLDIAFDSSSGSESFFVYLVEDGGASSETWTPDAGILLETKNLGTVEKPADVKAFVDLWNRPDTRPAGRSFRPGVFQGFPPHRPWDVTARRFSPSGAPTALHRYVGFFNLPPITEEQTAAVAKNISDWQAKLAAAQAEERTWSKERSTAESGLNTTESDLSRAQEASQGGDSINRLTRARDLAKKRFDDANFRWETATKRDIPTANAEIAIARQAQSELKDAVHSFHIGSVAGSWLLIDDRQLASWPGDKAPETEGGKFKNLASGQISLTPGTHKIEVYHYANGPDCLALLAWRRPGDRTATTMPRSAFFATGRHQVAATQFKSGSPSDPSSPLLFSWKSLRDFRVEGADDIVEFEFTATNPLPEGHLYRWSFGDGDSSEATQIRHAYFRAGNYTVTLEELDPEGKPIRRVTQEIEAHVHWESQIIHELAPLQEVIDSQNLAKLPFDLLANSYRFARIASPEFQQAGRWREKARAAIMARSANLPNLDTETLSWLALDSASFRAKAYDAALAAYAALLPKLDPGDENSLEIRLGHAELLLHAFGKPNEAESALQALGDPEGESLPRLNLLKADILLAKNLPQQAAEFLDSIAPSLDPAAETRFQVKNRSVLRHARLLSEKDDLDQIAHAIDMLNSVSRADPPMHLSPELNLIKLELFLARRDFVLAFHLSDRLLHLDFSELIRPKILGAQVRALHGLGAAAEASDLFAQLKEEYPYSPAVGTAEKALLPGP